MDISQFVEKKTPAHYNPGQVNVFTIRLPCPFFGEARSPHFVLSLGRD